MFFSKQLRVFNFNTLLQKADWTRLRFTLSKSCLAIVCSACNERRLSLNYNRSETHKLKIRRETNEYWRYQRVWVNWQKMTEEALQGNWLLFDRAERVSSYCWILSSFTSQESSEATLCKWAKFLSILNIILTSQQSKQQQRMNKSQKHIVDNLDARLDMDTP